MKVVTINGFIYICPQCNCSNKQIDHNKFYKEFMKWLELSGYIFEGSTKETNGGEPIKWPSSNNIIWDKETKL